jgi:hypothetical protein
MLIVSTVPCGTDLDCDIVLLNANREPIFSGKHTIIRLGPLRCYSGRCPWLLRNSSCTERTATHVEAFSVDLKS